MLSNSYSNTSTTNTAFTRTDFTVGEISKKERNAIIKDIEKFMILGVPIAQRYETFSVFYNETDAQEEIRKIFFKLKLRYPKFTIRISETAYSLRS